MTFEIVEAQKEDVTAVGELLQAASLPTDGFPEDVGPLLVAKENDRVIGGAGYELYRPYALLRSVVVDDQQRGRGLGIALIEAILEKGETIGVDAVYLLTETAVDFFPKFGFIQIDRDEVPDEVTQSIEFTSACPASAQAMVRTAV